MRSLWSAAVSMALFGCGASTGFNGTPAAPGDAAMPDAVTTDAPPVADRPDAPAPPESLHGELRNDCAPNDGPALTLTLVTGAAPVCDATPPASAQFEIYFWNPLPAAPGTYAVGGGAFASGSSGRWCATAATCQQATGGSVTFTQFSTSPDAFAGSVTLTLPDGSTRSARFSGLVRCRVAVGCG